MFSSKKYYLFILMGALILLTACGGGEIKLNAADNGQAITAAVGQTLVIELVSNPTTGYSWQIDQIDAAILQQVGEVQYASDSNLTGSGGVETFTFTVVGSGETTLTLIYHRTWEEGVAPIDIFILPITVE